MKPQSRFTLLAAALAAYVVLGAFWFGWEMARFDFVSLFFFVAMTGATAMFLIEAAKGLLPARAVYQAIETRAWLDRRSRELGYDSTHPESMLERYRAVVSKPVDYAFRELEEQFGARMVGKSQGRISTLGKVVPLMNSPFNLPAEQYVAQVGAVVDNLMIAGRSSDLVKVATFGSGGPAGATDGDAARQRSVSAQLVLSLDELQTRLAAGWQYRVRLSAALISGCIGTLALALPNSTYISTWYALASLVVGGPVAWLMRDLVAVVERARR